MKLTRTPLEEKKLLCTVCSSHWLGSTISSYIGECERVPTILSSLRQELETQLSAAAENAFPGKGQAGSAGAMGAFVTSLEVKFVACFWFGFATCLRIS